VGHDILCNLSRVGCQPSSQPGIAAENQELLQSSRNKTKPNQTKPAHSQALALYAKHLVRSFVRSDALVNARQCALGVLRF
jgi:hypothetical protein